MPVRCFHQGKITLTEQRMQHREKQVTVPEVITKSSMGERNISNPKPNGLRRARCGREREWNKKTEKVRNRGHFADSVFPLQALTSAVQAVMVCCDACQVFKYRVWWKLERRVDRNRAHSVCSTWLSLFQRSLRRDGGVVLQTAYGAPLSPGVMNDATSPMATRAYGDVRLMYVALYSVVKQPFGVHRCAFHHICA